MPPMPALGLDILQAAASPPEKAPETFEPLLPNGTKLLDDDTMWKLMEGSVENAVPGLPPVLLTIGPAVLAALVAAMWCARRKRQSLFPNSRPPKLYLWPKPGAGIKPKPKPKSGGGPPKCGKYERACLDDDDDDDDDNDDDDGEEEDEEDDDWPEEQQTRRPPARGHDPKNHHTTPPKGKYSTPPKGKYSTPPKGGRDMKPSRSYDDDDDDDDDDDGGRQDLDDAFDDNAFERERRPYRYVPELSPAKSELLSASTRNPMPLKSLRNQKRPAV